MDTNLIWSPHDLLPQPKPSETRYSVDFFYEMVSKHLVKDVVRIMMNGIHLDLHLVEELQKTLDEQLDNVKKILANNPIIQEFLKNKHAQLVDDYIQLQKSKMKTPEEFQIKWNHKNMECRSYFMHIVTAELGLDIDDNASECLPTGVVKWPVNSVKKYAKNIPILQAFLDGQVPENHEFVEKAIKLMQEHKAALYNRKYQDNIENPKVELPEFNPGSSKQKKELFAWLGIKSETESKITGEEAWNRAELERVYSQTSDEDVKEIVQAMLDFSNAAIIRANFIEAFYNYSVDSRLYGTINLGAAISFRNTSKHPWLSGLYSRNTVSKAA